MNPGICYLYEYKNDQKLRNVGFMKVTPHYRSCILQINVRGIPVKSEDSVSLLIFYEEDSGLIARQVETLPCGDKSIYARLSVDDSAYPDGRTLADLGGFLLKTNTDQYYAAFTDSISFNTSNIRMWEAAPNPVMEAESLGVCPCILDNDEKEEPAAEMSSTEKAETLSVSEKNVVTGSAEEVKIRSASEPDVQTASNTAQEYIPDSGPYPVWEANPDSEIPGQSELFRRGGTSPDEFVPRQDTARQYHNSDWEYDSERENNFGPDSASQSESFPVPEYMPEDAPSPDTVPDPDFNRESWQTQNTYPNPQSTPIPESGISVPQTLRPQNPDIQPRNPEPQLRMPQSRRPQLQEPPLQTPQSQEPQTMAPQLQKPPFSNSQPQEPYVSNSQPQEPYISNSQPQEPYVSIPQPQEPPVSIPQPQEPPISNPQPQDSQPQQSHTGTARKIQRSDLSILPRRCWNLANNSFLMHGYHNYHHLLLVEEDGHFWLGVPGIYAPREARAAELFGFPQFTQTYTSQLELSDDEWEENEKFGYWCRFIR